MYALYLPMQPLQPYIECYWIVDAHLRQDNALHELIFVDGKADLLFNYGDAYVRNDAAISHTNLDAQRTYPVSITQVGHVQLVGVRFRPGGLAAFVAMPMREASGLLIDPQDCFGAAYRILADQLYDQLSYPQQVVRILNQFFCRQLRLSDLSEYAYGVASLITQTAGQVDVPALARETGYSARTLNRFFNAHFGFSLKFYARVVRFQHAHQALLGDSSLAEIALQTGYYDQSHFTREFSAFTGQAPSAYRTYLQQKQATAPNLVGFLQDD